MEEAVIEELKGILEKMKDVCSCERCREDILAYTLNRLPARYVVTVLGNAYTKLHQLKVQSKADIVVQLMEAAKVVGAKPRH